ncbi:SAPS-domain-containing protein [Auriscalpium vulgare]|uniref:SAPS-domain-containing protein n=1 Tax=Auriscalpium vulgare TaxID=40419 RepID=A0ACB8SDE7_9AGAM|nr:SAPS-domain-containing protein [Auriscalpium vulgare]
MFWRFGFNNGSSIDSLLDKDDVSLEAILDEDDLLQECKAQNTRLIDYFQRADVLQRLLGYVTGQIEGEERGRFKYPYVATEVLCSEIWSIVETCLNNTEQLLTPFWETVLDRPAEDMKTHMAMASHFAKINAVFLTKKPAEMLQFIRSQRDVVERLLQHIETPSFSDLLVRIIQLDEQPAGAGVLEWLSDERLMSRLIDRLAPTYSSDVHTVVAELIKGIISMAAPSPGAALSEGLHNGPASNRFARELARRENVLTLVNFILADFHTDALATATSSDTHTGDEIILDELASPVSPVLPTSESSASSVVQSIGIIIELIRQNNSDYFEPYLFHTLRNRLIHVQQQLTSRDPEEGRIALEGAMTEMVDRMAVVHLGPLLDIFCERLDEFTKYLHKPRSLDGTISTTVGSITPLTFERYKICELYAELLHCSNMALLNRSAEFAYLYDSDGRLQGGLSALEELARVISMGSGEDAEHDAMDEGTDDIEPALEFPIHRASQDASSSILDSDEDMSEGPGSSEDDTMEEIVMYEEPASLEENSDTTLSTSPSHTQSPIEPLVVPSSPNAAFMPPASEIAAQGAAGPATGPIPQRKGSGHSTGSEGSTIGRRSTGSKRSSRRNSRRLTLQDASQVDIPLPIGERLKQKLLDAGVLSMVLDLFFNFPWNNFLHSVVYDLIHQILTGRVDGGINRSLTVALFRDAHLMQRIVEGQKRNDQESSKLKGVRLGYMGHLTLISEDVITSLNHFPPDLRLQISPYAPQPDWDDYVTGRYNETKQKDSSLLGGGKPVIAVGATRTSGQWKVDEEDSSAPSAPISISGPASGSNGAQEAQGEFRRATGARPTRESSADFGPAPVEQEEEDFTPPSNHFARYLAQEIHSADEFGGSSSSSDASDEEDGGWLTQSHFGLDRSPPTSARPRNTERRPLNANGFDDAFVPPSSPFTDPFATEDDEDEGFGPFSDSAAASGTDPFSFSSSFSDDIQDASFDSFGDFGEFHSAGDGETTPTAGSWTLTSGSSSRSSPSSEGGDSDEDSKASKGEGPTENPRTEITRDP